MEKIKDEINKKVDLKIKHLATWYDCQYPIGGRLYVETDNLKGEIAEFTPGIQVYYLERLKEQLQQRKTTIQGNLPSSAPDITGQFIDWLENQLIDLKIKIYSMPGTQPGTPEPQPEPETPEPENTYPNIFSEGGYKLFGYLNENYTRHDHQPKTKYSNLYRYLKYEQFIECTQQQYMGFIKKNFCVKMTKVFVANYASKNDIKDLLTRLKSNFKNST